MSRPPGVALVLTIAGLAALALLSAGLIAAAVERGATGSARASALRARLAAVSGTNAAIAGWPAQEALALAVGQRLTSPISGTLPGDAGFVVHVERLAGGLFLLRAEGRAGSEGAAGRAGADALIRALDPGDLAASFPAGLASAGESRIAASARLDALRPADPPPPWTAFSCPPIDAAPSPAVVLPDESLADVAAGARVDGQPPVAGGWLPSGDALPPLFWSDIAALADRTESGSVSPAPSEIAGECLTRAPRNWGSPLDPEGACGGWFPLIHAPGSLRVTGGSGQGVLAVEGDLTLEADARFYGAIVVGGRLVVQPGAIIYGAALARGEHSQIGGQIHFGRCAVTRAIARSPGLSRPLLPPGRHVLPAFLAAETPGK